MNSVYAGNCESCGADIRSVADEEPQTVPTIIAEEPYPRDVPMNTEITEPIVEVVGLDDIYDQLEQIKVQLSTGATLLDVNMPFGQMVILFIKVILAAIPAIIIVGSLLIGFWVLFGGLLFNVFFSGYGVR